ncbi:hypothetical protein P186_0288 [Pyrobaculum ferrireducens]|uniref:Uncharacterized protein n=1 Tax=Pyrobaculum ferrireducens TaxID=1104324 RepID=G7VFT9_9CREN|nr:hypothetical protein P186_0288 [Pyrobaculum ferrireducens]
MVCVLMYLGVFSRRCRWLGGVAAMCLGFVAVGLELPSVESY